MKKKFVFSVIAVVFVLVLAVVAFAHSGRTDSNGGHYNRSTGEYHYHHGYSAHNHYDMDGDGIDDCPYTFERKAETTESGERADGVRYYKTDDGRIIDISRTTNSKETVTREATKSKNVRTIIDDMLSYVLNLKVSELPLCFIFLAVVAFFGYCAAAFVIGYPYIFWCEFTKRKYNEQTINKLIVRSSIVFDIAFVLYALYEKVT